MRLCECGCGQAAPIATKTRRAQGHVKGEPVRFVAGHQVYLRVGPKNPRWGKVREKASVWKGGRIRHGAGYMRVLSPGHPRAYAGYVLEHILVAEKALGRFLRRSEEVHHVNEDRADNSRGNLVICQDHAYHALLHKRLRALRATRPAWATRQEENLDG